ncbi:MAG: alpha/beta hydrolase family esterase [Acidimicrobiales bacterium]
MPTGYTGTTRVALILNMHGSGSDAKQQEEFTGMDATSDRDGFIVAYPQALITDGAGFDWNVPDEPLVTGSMPPESSANDVAFLTQLPSVLGRRYCVDLRRAYATGMSGGGRMASQLACNSPRTFAAVAPVAGLRFPAPCATSRYVPVVAFHGSADPVDPYSGNGLGYWTYSVPVAEQRWAAHESCPHTTRIASQGYELTASTGCAGASTVELYSLTGEGHEWPGGPTMPASITKVLGPQTTALDANSVMWAFFTAYRLP